jgi:hypothetical protein
VHRCRTEIFRRGGPLNRSLSGLPGHPARAHIAKPRQPRQFRRRSLVVIKCSNNNRLFWLSDQDSNLNDPNCNSLKDLEIISTQPGRDKNSAVKVKCASKEFKRDHLIGVALSPALVRICYGRRFELLCNLTLPIPLRNRETAVPKPIVRLATRTYLARAFAAEANPALHVRSRRCRSYLRLADHLFDSCSAFAGERNAKRATSGSHHD